jgi:aspartate oxidase
MRAGNGLAPASPCAVDNARCVRCRAAKPKPVAVVGSGIMGLTTAYQLRQAFSELPIHIISEDRVPKTTSYGSGGMLQPLVTLHR